MKKITLILSIAFFFTLIPTTWGQTVDSPSFELLAPMERQTYQLGDTLVIKWRAHNFTPSNLHGITVNLADRNSWKRTRIGFVTQPTDDGVYTVKWTIPDDFFWRKKIDGTSADFKIEIRAWDGDWFRALSTRSLVNIIDLPGNMVVTKATVVTEEEVDEEPTETPVVSEPTIDLPASTQLASRYTFTTLLEPWVVQKLTVVNDTEGDGFELDLNETSDVIENIYVRYPDELGVLRVKSAPFVQGKATLSDLDFYIEKRNSADLEIWVDTVDPEMFGETYSGQTYRVGLLETGNNASTFRAVGQISSTVTNSPGGLSAAGNQIEEFVVRGGSPVFALIGSTERDLYNGEMDVYEFSVSAASNVGLARLVFDVTQGGLTTVDQVRILRNGTPLTPGDATSSGKVYLRWDAGVSSCFAHTAQNGIGTGMDCTGSPVSSAKLIVAFTEEEKPFGAEPVHYKIRFNVNGAHSRDRIAVRLSPGDDNASLNVGGVVPTTGMIFNGGGGNELFFNSTDFASEATTLTDRNIVWSDSSADLHRYPTITPNTSPTVSTNSSADFTNGYLLKLNALPYIISVR